MVFIIQNVIDILENSENILFPVKKLWLELQAKSVDFDETFEGLVHILDGNPQFRIYKQMRAQNAHCCESIVSNEEMEKAGFFQGPWVALRDRIPTHREAAEGLIEKADRTFETLKNAWEIRPLDNEVIEDQLLFALAKTQQLRNELRMIFGKKNS
jgi:hypothetical protein